jgi:diguanylate cyclase (GGDEF)-like protein
MKEPYEINVDIDMANSDAMTIFINYKVFDYDGIFIGATGVGMTVDSVIRMIDSYQHQYHRNVYLVDREGNIRLTGDNTTVRDLHKLEGLSDLADTILSSDTPDKTNYFQYTREGKTIHLHTRFIPEFKWFLFVEQDELTAIREIRHAMLVNLVFGAVISIVVIGLVSLVIHSYEKRLENVAMTDSLTGISNRLAFEITLEETIALMEKEKRKCSALLIDIDHFKRVNDDYDHFVGDAVIRHITSEIKRNIRESDFFGRWGGEEFIVLLRDAGIEDAYRQAERLRHAVKDNPYIHEGDPILVTISIGIAQYRHGEGEDKLLSRTDKALYLAKENGRDRTERVEN